MFTGCSRDVHGGTWLSAVAAAEGCVMRQVFKAGLLDAVRKTNAWVVTGGTSAGRDQMR